MRNINKWSDLTESEQDKLLKDLDKEPCIFMSLEFLERNYGHLLNIDFSEVEQDDKERIVSLTPEQLRLIVLHDSEALRALADLMSQKIMYAKAYEALVLDYDRMDMRYDPFRARCKTEYEEQHSAQQLFAETGSPPHDAKSKDADVLHR